MVNNNFCLIGTTTSNFELIVENEKYSIYQCTIEVEKRIGTVAQFKLKSFSTSTGIDFKQNYRGKVVAVNGYIDVSYIPNNSEPFISLICTNIKVLGNANNSSQRNTIEN